MDTWRLKAILLSAKWEDEVGTAQLLWLRKEVESEELMHGFDGLLLSNMRLEIIPGHCL